MKFRTGLRYFVPPHEQWNDRFKDKIKSHIFCTSKALNAKHPERNRSFNEQLKKENPQGFKPFHFYETRCKFIKNSYRDVPGYSQLERALAVAGFSSASQQLGGRSMEAPNSGCPRAVCSKRPLFQI
jgi:hypothetical protein